MHWAIYIHIYEKILPSLPIVYCLNKVLLSSVLTFLYISHKVRQRARDNRGVVVGNFKSKISYHISYVCICVCIWEWGVNDNNDDTSDNKVKAK